MSRRSNKGAVLVILFVLGVLLQVPYHMEQVELTNKSAPTVQKQ